METTVWIQHADIGDLLKKTRISIIEVFCWVVGSYVEVKGDGVRGETFSLC